MTIDTKLTVLYALYIEWQKDLPELFNVTASSLGMELPVFNVALFKLQREGYIDGADFKYADQSQYPVFVVLNRATLTAKGIEKTETDLGLAQERTNKEKLQRFTEKAAAFGWQTLTQIAATVITQLVTKG